MNILFIGGSNTRMANGYVKAVCDRLNSDPKFGPVSAENISVGISGSSMGIEQFLRRPQETVPDVVFIEYAINDVSVLAKQADLFWKKSYEGLVRLVSAAYPDTPIYNLHFKSLTEAHWPLFDQIKGFAEQLAQHYPTFHALDIAGQISAKYDGATSHRDDKHYAERVFGDIADIVHQAILGYEPAAAAAALPEPLTPAPFENCSVIYPEQFSGGERQRFENSILGCDTLILRDGESAEVEIPGEVAGISFISSSKAGILELVDGNGHHFIPTLHQQVESGNFANLLMNAPVVWHDWSGQIPAAQKIVLRCRSRKAEPFRSYWSMVPPSSEDVWVQIRSVLVAGR